CGAAARRGPDGASRARRLHPASRPGRAAIRSVEAGSRQWQRVWRRVVGARAAGSAAHAPTPATPWRGPGHPNRWVASRSSSRLCAIASPGATSLTARRRESDLAAVADGPPVDLLVVGLGVTGAGVALDAASRGLSVTAVDMDDLAFGTSRWS